MLWQFDTPFLITLFSEQLSLHSTFTISLMRKCDITLSADKWFKHQLKLVSIRVLGKFVRLYFLVVCLAMVQLACNWWFRVDLGRFVLIEMKPVVRWKFKAKIKLEVKQQCYLRTLAFSAFSIVVLKFSHFPSRKSVHCATTKFLMRQTTLASCHFGKLTENELWF